MANIDVEIGGRRYTVACRDGEEAHLRSVAALVDERARTAAAALGPLTEARLLMFTALLLADDLKEARSGGGTPLAAAETVAGPNDETLVRLAERLERIAAQLEQGLEPGGTHN